MDGKDIELRIRARYDGKKTFSEITNQIRELNEELKQQQQAAAKGTADVTAMETSYKKLEGALKNVASAFGDTQRYENQQAALARVAQHLEDARRKQAAFDASLNKGAQLTKTQERRQDQLARAVDRAGAAMAKAQARVDATGAKLKRFGVDTNNLSAAQTRMVAAILNGNRALGTHEQAIERAARAQRAFSASNVPAALNRIRNSVLALATAYMGVHRAAGLASSSTDAFSQREGVKNQLALSVGNDRAAIDAEYEYVRKQADRIGIEFDRAVQGYAKFAAAARMAGRSGDEIRYIWEAFAEVGRVANLSAEDLDGVFKALEQITSKGRIQAEELRGQLGDRLFGAFQVAAKALQDQFPDLDKAMKSGLVTSEQLVAIAEEYRRTVADQLPAASASLAAQQARLNNEIREFQLAIADAGWAEAFGNAVREVTTALKSDDGKRLAEALAAGFSAVADALVWVLRNLDQVFTVAKALASLWAINQAGKAAAGILAYGNSLKALSTDIRTTVKGLGLIRGAFALLQAAVAGWAVGTYLRNEFAAVRKAGVWLVTGLDEMWTRLKHGAQLAFHEIPRYTQNAFADVINAVARGTRRIVDILRSALRAIGRHDLAAELGRTLDGLTVGYADESERAAEIRQSLERELDQIRRIRADMLADAEGLSTAGTPGATGTPTPRPAITPSSGTPATSEKDIAKRQRLVDEIARGLESLETRIDRAESDSLQAQLDAIEGQYAALSRKIGALGGDTGAEFTRRLDQALSQLRAQTIAKFNAGLEDEYAALLAKLDRLDAAAGRKSKTDLAARLAAVRSQYEATYREIAEYRDKLEANDRATERADAAKARLDAGIAELQRLETQKFYKDELRRLEGEINDALATRSDRLRTIADQEAAGLITTAQARQQTEEAVNAMQPRIEGLVDVARAFAESLQGAFDPVALDGFIAKLDLARNSGAALGRTFQLTGREVEEMIANRSLQAFDAISDAIGGAIVRTHSWRDALRETARAFLKFAADFLQEITKMILKQRILQALQGTGWGGAIAGAVNAAVRHDGGRVGDVAHRSRTVSPFVFKQAPRYHSGGLVGLAPDEYPAILQRNEEVLSSGDPRNVINGGTKGAQSTTSNRPMRFIFVDDERKVEDYLRSAESDDVFVEKLRRNSHVIRSLGGK